MFRKIILCIMSLLFMLCGCTVQSTPVPSQKNDAQDQDYVKAVWVTYYELSGFTLDNSESAFKKLIGRSFKELAENGFNRVTVQVRPCADAFYNSQYFPISEYCFGEQGSELKYDPLKIMVNLAHRYNMSVEAWINPYRVSQNTDFSRLCSSNIALKWKDTENLIVTDTGIYFNPACDDVTNLIVNGVKEIIANYEVDSVCFDDYFYPTTDSKIDKNFYKEYKASGGGKTLSDWRRENVSNMIKEVYHAVKSINSNVTFGISPASNIENNYSSLYADTKLWCTQKGYVDYICPQIYFGFKNENQPFMKTAKLWSQTAECDLYIALPLYKAEKSDEFAGEAGVDEFKKNSNIIARQVNYISKLDNIKGFYIFSYSSLKENEETKNLYLAMQNSPSE